MQVHASITKALVFKVLDKKKPKKQQMLTGVKMWHLMHKIWRWQLQSYTVLSNFLNRWAYRWTSCLIIMVT